MKDSNSESGTSPNANDADSDASNPSVDESHKPTHAFDIFATYRYYRYSIVHTLPFGQLVWDITRIFGTVAIIAGIFLILTGLLTPFVAVASGSMDPNIKTGDLVMVTAHTPDDPPPLAGDGSITTVADSKTGDAHHHTFGRHGDVIVFAPTEGDTPIIHRAHFWVEEGENWVANADPDYLGDVESCTQIPTCPAPNDGYITAGDDNGVYDQIYQNRPPISEDQIIGVAQFRIPWLGWIRIGFELVVPW